MQDFDLIQCMRRREPPWFATLRALSIALAVSLTACGDAPSDPPSDRAGFTVLSGPDRSDTILALVRPLRVELRDGRRALQPGVPVMVRSMRHDSLPGIYLDSATQYTADTTTRTTDALGQFTIDLRFGRRAGATGLILSAPSLAMVDTVEFTVLAGAPYNVTIVERDTAVVLGREMTLTIAVRDRWGNPRSDAPDVQASPGLRYQGNGRVIGLAYGVSTLTARAGGVSDAIAISVVPPGRIAGLQGFTTISVFVVNTDGTGAKPYLRFLGWPNGVVQWSRNGSLLLSTAPAWPGPFRLLELRLDGSERILWTAPQGTHQGWPSFSMDEAWVYFVHAMGSYEFGEGAAGIWRVRPDGSSPELVVAAPATGGGWRSPSASPAGDYLAYAAGDGSVYVRTLADGSTRAIAGLGAATVRWSPVGSQLLVAGSTGVIVLNADGTGRRQLRPRGLSSVRDAAWSPDGTWIIWRAPSGPELVQVETGIGTVLPFFGETTFSGGAGWAWTTQP
jgi:hypothetical protein